MRGGIGDDRVANLAGAPLAPRSLGRDGPGGRELIQQRVARGRELGDARDPWLGRVKRRGLGGRIGRVRGELRLELADLAAQLAPSRALRRIDPTVRVEAELG